MSRIHEALKRAEQERAASQGAKTGDRAAQSPVSSGVIDAPPPVRGEASSKLTSSRVSGKAAASIAADSGSLTFDTLWAKCAVKRWSPDPKVVVFESEDPFVPGAEQFRTLRSRL